MVQRLGQRKLFACCGIVNLHRLPELPNEFQGAGLLLLGGLLAKASCSGRGLAPFLLLLGFVSSFHLTKNWAKGLIEEVRWILVMGVLGLEEPQRSQQGPDFWVIKFLQWPLLSRRAGPAKAQPSLMLLFCGLSFQVVHYSGNRLTNQPLGKSVQVSDREVVHFSIRPCCESHFERFSERVKVLEDHIFKMGVERRKVRKDLVGGQLA